MLVFGSFLHASMLLLLSGTSRHSAARSSTRRSTVRRSLATLRDGGDRISSTQSNTIKKIQALLNKRKKRQELNQVVVEGPRMVMDLYKAPRTRSLVRQVVIDEDKWDAYSSVFSREKDDTDNEDNHLRIIPATAQVLKACTDTVTNQGIVAVCDIPKYEAVLLSSQRTPLFLVLDGVSDPGNLGTLLRSSLATGVAGVYLLPETCDPWNPKAVRSAMGSTFQLPIKRFNSWSECVEHLESVVGCTNVYAATMLEDRPGLSHYDVDWISHAGNNGSANAQSVALVIGSEGNGLTPPLRQAVERGEIQAVHVPMEPGIESLNAGVCGSVILFEYYRQRRVKAK